MLVITRRLLGECVGSADQHEASVQEMAEGHGAIRSEARLS